MSTNCGTVKPGQSKSCSATLTTTAADVARQKVEAPSSLKAEITGFHSADDKPYVLNARFKNTAAETAALAVPLVVAGVEPWSATQDYAKGDLAVFDGVLFRATGPVAASQVPPSSEGAGWTRPDAPVLLWAPPTLETKIALADSSRTSISRVGERVTLDVDLTNGPTPIEVESLGAPTWTSDCLGRLDRKVHKTCQATHVVTADDLKGASLDVQLQLGAVVDGRNSNAGLTYPFATTSNSLSVPKTRATGPQWEQWSKDSSYARGALVIDQGKLYRATADIDPRSGESRPPAARIGWQVVAKPRPALPWKDPAFTVSASPVAGTPSTFARAGDRLTLQVEVRGGKQLVRVDQIAGIETAAVADCVGELRPGATKKCRTTYVVTDADVERGFVALKATALASIVGFDSPSTGAYLVQAGSAEVKYAAARDGWEPWSSENRYSSGDLAVENGVLYRANADTAPGATQSPSLGEGWSKVPASELTVPWTLPQVEATLRPAPEQATSYTRAGDTLGYQLTLTNTGHQPVTVEHAPRADGIEWSSDCLGPLDAGASVTCEGSHTVSAAEVDQDQVATAADVRVTIAGYASASGASYTVGVGSNTVTATNASPAWEPWDRAKAYAKGDRVIHDAKVYVADGTATMPFSPKLLNGWSLDQAATKALPWTDAAVDVDLELASDPPGSALKAGDTLTFEATITNHAQPVRIDKVYLLSAGSRTTADCEGTLGAGERRSCRIAVTISDQDVAAGTFAPRASVLATIDGTLSRTGNPYTITAGSLAATVKAAAAPAAAEQAKVAATPQATTPGPTATTVAGNAEDVVVP